MASQFSDLHMVVFPYMAQGHMIPMVDIARMLAQRGVKITIVTTPVNAARFESVLSRAKGSGLPIQTVTIPFPSEKVGLPQGVEHLDNINSFEILFKFHLVLDLLGEPLEKVLEELSPKPNCIISDIKLACTYDVATKFQIPRICFNGSSCIATLCSYRLSVSGILDSVTSDTETFVVPDVPDRIVITKGQAPSGNPRKGTKWREIMDNSLESDLASYGLIVNSFEELELAYAEELRKFRGGKFWCFGPVSLSNKEDEDKAERGSKVSFDQHECVNWLDSFEPCSVLYACLGSTWGLSTAQLIELALGLEASNRPFMWMVGKAGREEFDKWNTETGYEERIKERGFLIRGWAPQVVILSHPSLGGFLTHCGWNSTIEGVTAGVPMLTWPFIGDQFANEKLLVQILKIGVSVGGDDCTALSAKQLVEQSVKVKKEDIKKAIDSLFMEGGEGDKRRERAKELQKLAVRSQEKEGSSYMNLTRFIEDIMQHTIAARSI